MSTLRSRIGPRIGVLTDLFSLFAGRIGGILVTFVFIPQFSRLLGSTVFGSVAVVLSLQAFFLVSDLGLATLISRDTAIARGDAVALTAVVWMRRRAEAILSTFAIGIAVIAVAIPLLVMTASPWSLGTGANVAMIAMLIFALIVTNVAQLSLNSLGFYRMGAATAVIGAMVRGGATVAALRYSPTFAAFLLVQLCVAMVHFMVVRWLVERGCRPLVGHESLLQRDAVVNLLRRCVPLTVYTLASAAAVNLDKAIVSAFISLDSAGVYFLATTYALVPVAVLSGPINSYFSPRVAHARHAGDRMTERRLALTFQLVLMCMVMGPSLGLAFQMAEWLNLWLSDPAKAARIMEVAPILLAGGALSATGYYPTTFLIAEGDNGYLARLSLLCGIGVLVAAVLFASLGDLIGLAWSYFAFYAAGFTGLWVRMARLPDGRALLPGLVLAYAIPAVAIAIGYFATDWMINGSAPRFLRLLLPMAIGSALGMVTATAMFRIALRRASVHEPSFGTIS